MLFFAYSLREIEDEFLGSLVDDLCLLDSLLSLGVLFGDPVSEKELSLESKDGFLWGDVPSGVGDKGVGDNVEGEVGVEVGVGEAGCDSLSLFGDATLIVGDVERGGSLPEASSLLGSVFLGEGGVLLGDVGADEPGETGGTSLASLLGVVVREASLSGASTVSERGAGAVTSTSGISGRGVAGVTSSSGIERERGLGFGGVVSVSGRSLILLTITK